MDGRNESWSLKFAQGIAGKINRVRWISKLGDRAEIWIYL